MNLIETFYTAFAKGDWQTMANCYHPDAEFTDEVFVGLKGKEVPAMWRMLIERGGGNMEITHSHVQLAGEQGNADWVAVYIFSATGRRVINRIHAEFELKDGKIFRHRDSFDLHKWAGQAMGFKGQLLGGTGFFRKKVRKTARAGLDRFLSRNN
ncbi:nuclear transport factor 2 family protein [Lacibacter luteus]|uniref:Nuclear transport factor 2 family protein n=1 Tax=Lacibacter luteus TaxID=2508719 RepID=A0A4Q1CFL9_9BACT|nr:nuclear transport factor 2 family protein [Lacibacter luteus]RXK58816.1 nuclear transport factor 2 family protein [Lacibacter luteus]